MTDVDFTLTNLVRESLIGSKVLPVHKLSLNFRVLIMMVRTIDRRRRILTVLDIFCTEFCFATLVGVAFLCCVWKILSENRSETSLDSSCKRKFDSQTPMKPGTGSDFYVLLFSIFRQIDVYSIRLTCVGHCWFSGLLLDRFILPLDFTYLCAFLIICLHEI